MLLVSVTFSSSAFLLVTHLLQFNSMSAVDRWLTEIDRRSLEWTRTQTNASVFFLPLFYLNKYGSADLSIFSQFLTGIYYQGHSYLLKCYHKFCSLVPIYSILSGFTQKMENPYLYTINFLIQYVPNFISCIFYVIKEQYIIHN